MEPAGTATIELEQDRNGEGFKIFSDGTEINYICAVVLVVPNGPPLILDLKLNTFPFKNSPIYENSHNF